MYVFYLWLPHESWKYFITFMRSTCVSTLSNYSTSPPLSRLVSLCRQASFVPPSLAERSLGSLSRLCHQPPRTGHPDPSSENHINDCGYCQLGVHTGWRKERGWRGRGWIVYSEFIESCCSVETAYGPQKKSHGNDMPGWMMCVVLCSFAYVHAHTHACTHIHVHVHTHIHTLLYAYQQHTKRVHEYP